MQTAHSLNMTVCQTNCAMAATSKAFKIRLITYREWESESCTSRVHQWSTCHGAHTATAPLTCLYRTDIMELLLLGEMQYPRFTIEACMLSLTTLLLH